MRMRNEANTQECDEFQDDDLNMRTEIRHSEKNGMNMTAWDVMNKEEDLIQRIRVNIRLKMRTTPKQKHKCEQDEFFTETEIGNTIGRRMG